MCTATESGTHLGTCVVAEVHPVDLELAVVVGVDELVGERVLHVLLAGHAVLAQQDTMGGGETSCAAGVAWVTLHGRGRELAAGHLEVFEEEDNHRAWRLSATLSSCGIGQLFNMRQTTPTSRHELLLPPLTPVPVLLERLEL